MNLFRFKTKNENCFAYIVEKTYSSNGSLCLMVYSSNRDAPLCVATTNIAGYHCDPGNVLIKNWSENEGVYEALVAANVISPVIRHVPTGFVTAYECKYLKESKVNPTESEG